MCARSIGTHPVPTVPEALSKELDDLETRFGEDRPAIELNLARFFLVILLGVDWGDKWVNLRPDPDPWMLNGDRAWLAKHPVPSDVRRIVWHYRTVRLANALFTLATEGRTTGYERLRLRFMTRPDMRATFTEAEIASLLVTNRCEVEIVGESGIRGNDFDLLAKVEQTPVSVEVTVISGADLSAKTVSNRLHEKRDQVPGDRPAWLYLHVPAPWMTDDASAYAVFTEAIGKFMTRSQRFNGITLVWEEVIPILTGGIPQMSMRSAHNNRPRHSIPDVTVFTVKPNAEGKLCYASSLVERVTAYRDKRWLAV